MASISNVLFVVTGGVLGVILQSSLALAVGSNALIDALSDGKSDQEVIEILRNGTDVNEIVIRENTSGRSYETTALFEAVENGREVLVDALLERGAKVNLRVKHRIFLRGDRGIVLHLAASRPNSNIVRMLLDAKADVCFILENDDINPNALFWAAHEPVNFMLVAKYGGDLNHLNGQGETPLDRLVKGNRLDLIQFALGNNAIPTQALIKQVMSWVKAPLISEMEKLLPDFMTQEDKESMWAQFLAMKDNPNRSLMPRIESERFVLIFQDQFSEGQIFIDNRKYGFRNKRSIFLTPEKRAVAVQIFNLFKEKGFYDARLR